MKRNETHNLMTPLQSRPAALSSSSGASARSRLRHETSAAAAEQTQPAGQPEEAVVAEAAPPSSMAAAHSEARSSSSVAARRVQNLISVGIVVVHEGEYTVRAGSDDDEAGPDLGLILAYLQYVKGNASISTIGY